MHSCVDEYSHPTSLDQHPTKVTVTQILKYIPLREIPVLVVLVRVTQEAVAALYLCFM